MESESSISLLTSVRSFVMLFHANVDDQRTFLYLTVAKKSNLLPHKAKNEKKNLTIFKIKRFKSFFGTRLYCSSSPSSCNSSRATQEKTLNKKKATSLIRIASVFFFFFCQRITDVFLLQFPEKLLCKKKFCRFLSWSS